MQNNELTKVKHRCPKPPAHALNIGVVWSCVECGASWKVQNSGKNLLKKWSPYNTAIKKS